MLALCLQQAAQPLSQVYTVVPMVLMFVLAWFLLIRPAQTQRREQEAMRKALKPGDKVMTTGGIYGVVTRVRDDSDRMSVRVADGVQIELAKSAIASVVSDQE